jgi:hypothetical protein
VALRYFIWAKGPEPVEIYIICYKTKMSGGLVDHLITEKELFS